MRARQQTVPWVPSAFLYDAPCGTEHAPQVPSFAAVFGSRLGWQFALGISAMKPDVPRFVNDEHALSAALFC